MESNMATAEKACKEIEVLFSYSHRDEKLRNELEKHLSIMKRQGLISTWHDRKIGAGDEWRGAIDEHLNSAHIILLLISADFLASDYCYDIEMAQAIERHKSGEARVIPIILRPVDWKGALFGELQALPTNAEPVTSSKWSCLDEAFTDIAKSSRASPRAIEPKSITFLVLASPLSLVKILFSSSSSSSMPTVLLLDVLGCWIGLLIHCAAPLKSFAV